jgi:hypothetical protein
LATTNDTSWRAGQRRRWRWRDRAASLIRHSVTGPAYPVCTLATTVVLPTRFCFLVAPVCFRSPPLARSGAARLAAIALTPVARAANHEDHVAVEPQATSGTKRACFLGSCRQKPLQERGVSAGSNDRSNPNSSIDTLIAHPPPGCPTDHAGPSLQRLPRSPLRSLGGYLDYQGGPDQQALHGVGRSVAMQARESSPSPSVANSSNTDVLAPLRRSPRGRTTVSWRRNRFRETEVSAGNSQRETCEFDVAACGAVRGSILLPLIIAPISIVDAVLFDCAAVSFIQSRKQTNGVHTTECGHVHAKRLTRIPFSPISASGVNNLAGPLAR